MTLTRSSRLFFDASCLFAAANSPMGGSSFLLTVCHLGYLQAVVSSGVLIEAERNIIEKRPVDVFVRYRELVASTPFLLFAGPEEHATRSLEGLFFEDAHAVASALESQSDFLITLDRRLEQRVDRAELGILALSPGAFLQSRPPEHGDYERIRSGS